MKEFATSGSKFFPLREAPILEAMLGIFFFRDFSWVCVKIILLFVNVPFVWDTRYKQITRPQDSAGPHKFPGDGS